MEKRILFICKQRIDSYGVSYGLVNSANFVSNRFRIAKLKGELDVDTKVVKVVDSNQIDKEVYEYKPTHVIIEALWVPPYKMQELADKWMKVRWVVRIHSKIPFLANEGIAFNWLCQYKHTAKTRNNLIVSANSEETVFDLARTMRMETVYLGNVYCPVSEIPSHSFKEEAKEAKNILDIGCFGALRPMKNHMNQAVAAVKFADLNGHYINFHVNSGRIEQNGEQVLKNLRGFFGCIPKHRLIEHPWMDHVEFIKTVKRMDIGMQVSFSESFNIVSADFVANGIPMVMSNDIDWSPRLVSANPSDTDDIVCKLERIWNWRNWGINKLSRCALARYNKKAFKSWTDFI